MEVYPQKTALNCILKGPIEYIPEKLTLDSKNTKESLDYLFMDILRDIYWTEKYILQKLPKIVKSIFNKVLLEVTEEQIDGIYKQNQRIEKCFDFKCVKASSKKSQAIEYLVQECNHNIKLFEFGHARDAALINTLQKINQYKISVYGTLKIMATVLNDKHCAILLRESKDEELRNDIILTDLAEKINQLAANMEEEEVD